MANYIGMARTNYFRVTDPERLKEIIGATCIDEDSLGLWHREENGETLYGFGGYGSISGLRPSFVNKDNDESGDDDDDPSFDLFEKELQKIIAPDDAIIITEIGHEKLRYLTAYSIIITAYNSDSLDLSSDPKIIAQQLLDNDEWKTRMEY